MNEDEAQRFALRIAPLAARVANFCDHAEHNEATERAWVVDAARELRESCIDLCAREDLSLVELYANRLGAIEARNVLSSPASTDGREAAMRAASWRDLQLVQVDHDREYHPDVFGLSKAEQLRHYALHLAKIVGAFAAPDEPADLLQRRLPDAVIFVLKLSTIMGERLEEVPLSFDVSSVTATSDRR